MSNIILDLYYGNLEFTGYNKELSPKLKSKLKQLVEIEDKLEARLSPEAWKTFVEYRELYNEFMCLNTSDGFLSGVKAGAKLTFEMFN